MLLSPSPLFSMIHNFFSAWSNQHSSLLKSIIRCQKEIKYHCNFFLTKLLLCGEFDWKLSNQSNRIELHRHQWYITKIYLIQIEKWILKIDKCTAHCLFFVRERLIEIVHDKWNYLMTSSFVILYFQGSETADGLIVKIL